MFARTKKRSQKTMEYYGKDILNSAHMRLGKKHMQHGSYTVYDHSVLVTLVCLSIARLLHLKTDDRALTRGALLHDYFLYDWHDPSPAHRLHGFTHAACALRNARRDFSINEKEENMILAHMFPLNLTVPRYRESILLCLSDKLCAVYETVQGKMPNNKKAA